MSTKSAVCTLFEGHHHYGVAALVNSLHKQGFQGNIYAGYRGNSPSWLKSIPAVTPPVEWPGAQSFQVSEAIVLHCLPLQTDYHFTNFKPDFMLKLWEGVASDVDQFFYFDPDIVLIASWSFLIDWVNCGIAVCEDVNSPLAEFHPRRVAWRRYFSANSIHLRFRQAIYVNGGFIGVQDKSFLKIWQKIQEVMAPQIGGLNRSSLAGTPLNTTDQGPLAPFSKTDQDALNAAIEAWHGEVSYVGKEAMAFEAGTNLMPHALGQPKPWQCSYLKRALTGTPPRLVDRAYWLSANNVLQSQPINKVRFKKVEIGVAAMIGRFYRRGTV